MKIRNDGYMNAGVDRIVDGVIKSPNLNNLAPLKGAAERDSIKNDSTTNSQYR